MIVTGPKSRNLLEKIGTDADLYLPWLSHHKAKVCGKPCHLMRVSFAGELGWEIHTDVENISTLYKEISDAGAKPFGMWGFKFSSHRKGISSLERRLINRLQPVRGWFVEIY